VVPAVPTVTSVEQAQRVIDAQAHEMHLLRLMVAKLKAQLAKSRHCEFGASSERHTNDQGLDHPVQGSLLQDSPGLVLDKTGADSPKIDTPAGSSSQGRHCGDVGVDVEAHGQQAANAPTINRGLPAHLPREHHVRRPRATEAHHDASGHPCGCTVCGARMRQIG
jgi:hypothetical protein